VDIGVDTSANKDNELVCCIRGGDAGGATSTLPVLAAASAPIVAAAFSTVESTDVILSSSPPSPSGFVAERILRWRMREEPTVSPFSALGEVMTFSRGTELGDLPEEVRIDGTPVAETGTLEKEDVRE
jgi:hypothetical protein